MRPLKLAGLLLVVSLAGPVPAQTVPPNPWPRPTAQPSTQPAQTARPAQTTQPAQPGIPSAQPRQANYPPAAAVNASSSQVGNLLEHQLAAWLLLGNQEEIAVSQLALQRARNDDVKHFAQTMIEDHGKLVARLARFAPGLSLEAANANEATKNTPVPRPATAPGGQQAVATSGPGAPTAQGTTSPTADASRQPTIEQGAAMSQGHGVLKTLLTVEQQAAENCVSMVREELSHKQGAEFDKGYIGQQIDGHIGMLAKLKAVDPYASGEFKQIVADAQSGAQMHLEEAKKIMKELER